MPVNWNCDKEVARQFENERRDKLVLEDNPILQPGSSVDLTVPFLDTSSQTTAERKLRFSVGESYLSLGPSVVAELIDQDQPV